MSKAKFKKNHFLVIKEAVDPKVANFVYNYFIWVCCFSIGIKFDKFVFKIK